MPIRWLATVVVVAAAAVAGPRAEDVRTVRYRFSFPEPQHRWMQVDATFSGLDAPTLELRMSRSSPGRYAIHDFAKNVYDVQAFDPNGRDLPIERPDVSGWTVSAGGPAVMVRYKVYGDRVDGTYLAIDSTHAHINMPAAVMWARGFEDRPVTLTFDPPASAAWQVATQLHAGSAPNEFSAPNLTYLMDSPVEFGPVTIQSFAVGPSTFRFAAHHTGTAADLQAFVSDVQTIVGQEGAIFGEYPPYEPGHYTFLADYLPYAVYDGMEHRNSTVMTSPGSIASSRVDLLETVAHEFFHGWNAERIRPRDLEPFDLDRANMSGSLWLAEGFTQYYGRLVLGRAGLVDLDSTRRTIEDWIDVVSNQPGRLVRSVEDMSRMAALTDGIRPADRTNWSITTISYYPFGAAIALALDLTLRGRSAGRVTLDDFMREMWQRYGKPGGARQGHVDRPYAVSDAEAVLADIAGDPALARDFFARYIQGRELADYARLLAPAGFLLRPAAPGRAWLGDLQLGAGGDGAAIATLVAPTWPIYAAGVDQFDEIRQLDGVRIGSMDDVENVLRRHKPGDRLTMVFVDRTGRPTAGTVTLAEDPHLRVVPMEAEGGALTAAQRAFRTRWLGPR